MSDLNFYDTQPVPEEPMTAPPEPKETQAAESTIYESVTQVASPVIQSQPAVPQPFAQTEERVSAPASSYYPSQSYGIPIPPAVTASPPKTETNYVSESTSPYTPFPNYPQNKYPAYSALPGGYAQPGAVPKREKKTKKEKRRYSMGHMFVVAMISALSCGVISAAIVTSQLPLVGTGTNGGTSTVKTVSIAEQADNLVSAVAEKSAPSVVGIRVTTKTNNGFFGESDAVGEGSGVIYTADGYIITNYHVISSTMESGYGFGNSVNNYSIEVFLPSDPDTAQTATIIGYDVSADLAVLKIEKTGLPVIEIGDSETLKVGDTAIAIGNPGGLEFMGSVSSGIISGLNRTLQTEGGTEMNLIQTDAAINPGNSGGALVDKQGRLIGINNSKMAGNGFEGMGFAIPVNEVVEITKRLIKNENQPQSYLGVTIDSSYNAETLTRMGYPAGVVVFSVAQGSPAEKAGIQKYDIITKINGKEITSYSQLNSEKNKYAPGETITVTVFRENKSYDVSITLGEMQTQTQQTPQGSQTPQTPQTPQP